MEASQSSFLPHQQQSSSRNQQQYHGGKQTVNLFSGQSIKRYPCVFCSGAHAATQCQQVTSIEERKKIIGNKKILQLFQPETSKQRISVTFILSELWSSSSLQFPFQSCKVQQSFNVANESQQEPLSNDSFKFQCV
jgi:hypothetical protein